MIFFSGVVASAAPAGWSYYKILTTQENQITVGTNNLTDYPVLVKVTDLDLRHTSSSGYVESINGYDILFTSSDGNTIIPHEIEKYDPATGELVAWVKVPLISATVNTDFYMYFGNSSIVVNPSSNTTWDPGYVGVWHLHNTPNDATANGITLTATGATNQPGAVAADGEDIENAQHLAHTPINPLVQINGDLTLETWVNFESALQVASQENILMVCGATLETSPDNYNYSLNYMGAPVASANRLRMYWETGLGNDVQIISTAAANPGTGAWHHIAAVRDVTGSNAYFYFDGVQLGLPVAFATSPNGGTNTTFRIGRDVQATGRDIDADFDEPRISNVIRTPEWIQATYQNTVPGSTFITYGPTLCVFSDSANAGLDQSVCTSSAIMAGNSLSYGTGSWTLVSGSGTITTPNSPTTTITGLGVGPNVFEWTVTNSPFPPCVSFSDQVTITRDNIAPTLVCPPNQTANANATCGFVLPDYTALATINDNCGVGSLTVVQVPAAGTTIGTGVTPITITVTDANGNSSTCSFNVSVTDVTLPVFTFCPGNVAVNAAAGLCTAVVSWIAPTVSDNCAGVVLVQSTGLPSGSSFPVGVTNVSFTATDASGNISVCAFTVTVTDLQVPVFTSCPANISVNNTPGFCNAVVSWAAPTATDNCSVSSLTQTSGLSSGSAFPVGVTNISFTATDASGNTSVCAFTVTVTDNQGPAFTFCPANIVVNNTPGFCSAPAAWAAPSATDNCGGAVVITQTAGPVSGSTFPVGVTNISYTATDILGNTSVCAFTVTVNDNQVPVFTSCPVNISVISNSGLCSAVVSWAAPTVSDNCPGTIISQTSGLASGSAFPVGVTNVSFTATDASGNTSVCAFTVTVTDNEFPVFTSCPANTTVSTAPGVCTAVVNWAAPTASDNCAGMAISQTAGLPSGSAFPVGTTAVSFTATDASGNTAVCSFTVTVTETQAPVFTFCPANITVNNTPGSCTGIATWVAPTATDNCAGLVLVQTTGLPSGSAFPIGVSNIVYTATDAAGNTTLCSFTVTVNDNQVPVFTFCPANMSAVSTPGVCGAVVNWVVPTATDNCPGVVIAQTLGLSSGSVFPVGVTNISFTATDAYGNNSVCSFTVTVTDGEPPTFSFCPANITVANAPGLCNAPVSWVAPVGADNCPGVVIVQSAGLLSGSSFPVGVTPVSYTATDGAGNTAVCSFNVMVTDNETPVFTSCPANITVNNTPGSCSAVVSWVAPVVSENCPGLVVTQISGLPSGSAFPIGVSNISFSATDATGNTALCSFTVTVNDNQPPVFTSCPLNISVNNTAGLCSAVVNWVAPVTSDNCPGTVITQTTGLPSGSSFPIGATNISFTATDVSGNTATCSFTVTVTDNQAPVFTSCPANIITNTNPGVCGAFVSWIAPAASDNCAGITITQISGLASGSVFPIGNTVVSFTAVDAVGNSSLCSFTVTVNDNQAPTFTTCPANISVNANPGLCTAFVGWVAPGASDNCPGFVIIQTGGLPSGSAFPIGVTTITYTATDASSNTSICTFTVTVTDNQLPVFTSCPANIAVNSNPGLCSAVVSWVAPAATDNCGGLTLTQTAGLPSGSAFPIGVTNIAFTATDASGNNSVCAFTVTVTDNQLPVFTSCPVNISVNSNPGLCSAVVSWVAPAASDNCPGMTLTQTAGLPSGSAFPIGITNIVFTATDASGNSALCSFTITVADNQPPTFVSCPANIILNNTPGLCSAVVNWVAPVATDNCPGWFVSQTTGLPSGSSFPIGITNISFTATDVNGNTSLCAFTVTVIDNEAPVFVSCPANIVTNSAFGMCNAVVNWPAPVVTDNCPGVSLLQTAGPLSGSSFPIGITNIAFTATDAAGNTTVCSFTVNVVDNQLPVFTSCPANITVPANPGLCEAFVTWVAPAVTDNCPGVVLMQTGGLPSGSVFPVGTSNVTFTAIDNSGNVAVCAFTVTVTDNQVPVFTSCPVNISVNNDAGLCSAIVNWPVPNASDNCPGVVLVQSLGLSSGSAFPIGITNIVYTATDASGNTSLCTFSVIVTDNQVPVFTSCPGNISVNNNPGACSAIVSWVAPAATDNCPGGSVVQTLGPASGSAFPIGVTNISYTATDANGNTSICAFTVTVTDNENPVFVSCPANIVVNNTPGLCSSVVNWVAPVANDNCPGVTLVQTSGLPSGSAFPIGVTNILFTATDIYGNTSTCAFTVTVTDNQIPVFTSCPANIAVSTVPGLCTAFVGWVAPSASDNCPGFVITQTAGLPSGSSFPIGVTTVSYSVTDASGNTALCTFTVTVTDNQVPTFTSCPVNISVNNTPGFCSAVVNWAAPAATDNCPGLVIAQTTGFPSGSTFPIGTSNIVFTATDASGNSSTCSFTITVTDNQVPVFTSCPVNILVTNNAGSCGAIVAWAAPVATDNCPGLVVNQTTGLASGSLFPIGTTNVSFLATDASGNTAACSFTVTVTDNEAPVFTSCPSNISVANNPGFCSAIVTWTAPAATDNCAGVSVVQTAGPVSGSAFPIGVTNVSFTASDAYGNSTVCSFTVTVTDNQFPVFSSCPGNITTNNTPGSCSAIVSWVAPAATDNCAGMVLVQSAGLSSGSAFPIGVTNVSFTATDASGNITTCSFTVTVTDIEIPVFTSCPVNIAVNNTPGLCSSIVLWAPPAASDNCPGLVITQTAGLPSGSPFPIGVTNVSFTATDASGNTATCAFTVTVTDNQLPVFTSCPVNVSLNNTPGICGAVVSWAAPTATDNCPGLIITQTAGLPSGSTFPVGVTNVTFTASDASGNSAICSFSVTITDNEVPSFTSCPVNITVNNTPGSCSAVVSWVAPSATDNCPGLVLSQTTGLASGSAFPIGVSNISFAATDASGNTAICAFTVTVIDNQFPVFTSCPSNIAVTTTPGLCSASVSWIPPTATDNCAGMIITQTGGLASGSAFPVGITNVTFTATDASGNSTICAFTVTVTDNQLPVFTSCPANILINNNPGLCSAIALWVAPTATDNCAGLVITQTAGLPNGSAFPIGVTNVVFTATDADGNIATCSFTVTVVDNQLPVFTSCPGNISVNNDPGLCSAVVSWIAPAASDNCPGTVIVQTIGPASGSVFPIGTTNISFNATDAVGNVSVCAFTVTVTDNQAPIFSSCPANINLTSTPGLCSAVASWVPPVASDNCAGIVTLIQTAGPASGSAFPIGATLVNYTATDANGNISNCSFNVTVTDNEVPVFTSCPGNITVPNTAGFCSAVVAWAAPVATDNCPGVIIAQTVGLPSGSTFPIGVTNVSFNAIDASGNTSTCSFTVTVTDNESPVFTSCPANISVNNNPGLCSAIVSWIAPAASDNCPGTSIIQTAGLPSGSAFPIGITNIAFTATDAAGNSSVCSFTVTVTDNQFPVFASCPGNISVNNDPGLCSAVVTWIAPTASDNCAGMTLTQTAGFGSGSAFPVGVSTITFTATDASGNTTLCSFTVTVTDNQIPVFTSCPLSIAVNNDPGICSAVATWIAPTANDNCPGMILIQTAGLPSGSAFPIGVNNISFTATDASGNTAVCSFTVTVTDNQFPVFTSCPANISVNNDPGVCGAAVTWAVPAATDNCPGALVVQTSGLPSGSTFPIGTTAISYNVVDASGNISVCSFNVTVLDNQFPVFTSCPANISVNNNPGLCSAVVNWIAPTANDNCPGTTIIQTTGLPSGSAFPKGVSNIVFTATDAAGNSTTCSFTVTVTDNEFPVFTSCPGNISVSNDPGNCSAVVTWIAPVAVDNCAGMTMLQTAGFTSGSPFPVGVNTVTFTANDAVGNSTQCSFTVTVLDNQPPVYTFCPGNINVTNDPGNCSAVVTWAVPTAVDNCPGAVALVQTIGPLSGSTFPIGSTNISYNAIDVTGNIAVCAFTVTVTDNQFPVFTSCPTNITVNNTPGLCSAVASWAAPVAADNCAGMVLTQTAGLPSGSVFPAGITNISYNAIDASGNVTVCSFTVTVIDNQPPVFTSCPVNINVINNPGLCGAIVNWVAPAVNDNCPGTVITQTAGLPSGSLFPVGTTNISFTATDAGGNTATCSFTVTVTDNENPVFVSCPVNITIATNPGLCSALVSWVIPVASDNCPGVTITQTAGPANGSNFPIGVTNITYTALDAAGNIAICLFTVTVNDNQAPVFTSCPGNININNNAGLCSAVVSWIAPAAADNCPGVVTISQSAGLASGSSFPVGITNISFTATDAAGNSSTCSFTVTVTDNQLPVFTSCPGNISVNNNPGLCSAVVSWIAPTASDNCPGVSMVQTSGPASGSAFPVGVTNVSFTATDAAGNVSLCAFTVTVIDNQLPLFTFCPGNILLNNDPGLCSAVATWIAPSASDNCPGTTITLTGGLPSGSAFPVGTSNVTYTATDASGNAVNCTFAVTVIDNQTPVFVSCPVNITVNNDPGNCSALVSWVAPAATDNCPGMIITQTAGLPSGSVFPLGTTNIAFTATDAAGLSVLCSFTVTVNDNEAPTFTSCPSNIAVNNTPGLCSSVVSWAPPAASDNCPGAVIINQTAGLPNGSVFPIGATVVTFTATDILGNTSACSFTVTVTDNQAPIFTSCPANINVNNTAGTCGAVVTWIAPVANDNCPGTVITQSAGLPSGSTFPVGVTNVSFTATDAGGNTSTCSFTVTVTDNQLPVFTSCPINISVNNNPGVCGAVVSWVAPVANDNCPGLILIQTAGLISGSTFPIGVTNVSFTATDASGNTSVCAFTVTVTDNEVPVFTSCPANITVNNTPGNCSAVVTWMAPVAGDNCTGVGIVQTAGPASGSIFPLGLTNVSFMATDASGNTAICMFTVTVTDNEAPVFTSCPANLVVNNDAGNCTSVVTWPAPAASDNCPGVSIIQSGGLASGSTFPLGVTNVTFTATDASGNSAVCAFTVTVIDNEVPVFTSCPVNISVNNIPGSCSAAVNWIAPIASDNCPGVSVVQTAGLSSGSSFPIGVSNIEFTATDAAGNTTLCSFTVTVTDNEVPVFTSCPANINIINDAGNCSAVVNWAAPAATDNCAGTIITQPVGLPSGSAFPIGVTNISFIATDASGNSTVCSFTINVNDNELPGFTSCPSNISTCNPVVTFVAPLATDNCPSVNITQTLGLPSGSTFPLGNTTVQFTATDASGNTAICQFVITVLAPVTSTFVAAAPDTMCVLDADVSLTPWVSFNAGATDSFTVTAGGVIPTQWTFSPSASGTGVYQIEHFVFNAGCSDSSTHQVTVVPVANASWTIADTLCEAAGAVTLTGLQPGGTWSGPGVTGNTFDPTGMGGTTINISHVVGFGACKDTLIRSIYISPDVSPAWAFVLDTICSSNGIIALNTLVTGTPGGTWSGPGVTGNNFDPAALTGIVNVTYTVGESFCAESLTLPIEIIVQPVTDAGNDTSVCGLIDTLNATAFIGNGIWSSPALNISFSNASSPTTQVTSTIEGTFMLIWSESIGGTCFADDTVMVTFWNIPTASAGPDQVIDINDALLGATIPAVGTGVWSSTTTGPVIATPGNAASAVNNLGVGDNIFTWTVTNGTCPAITDDVIITVNSINIPAGISPNGDGLNDVWIIGGIGSLGNELIIFNRWGQEVYSKTNYQNDWDGTKPGGEILPDDTYFYILKVTGYEDFTGYIIIKR